MKLVKRAFVFLTVLLCSFTEPGPNDYRPGPTHSSRSHKLLRDLERQKEAEKERCGIGLFSSLNDLYNKRTQTLVNLVKDSFFLNNKDIREYLDLTFQRLVSANPEVTLNSYTLLAARSPFPNAACVGEGTFFFTTEMISLASNQSQLAAVLAHELAHYQLNHMKEVLSQVYEARKAVAREGVNVFTGQPTAEALMILRNQFFQLNRFSRRMEFEADSLGFQYFFRAGFRDSEFISMLGALDPGDSLDYTIQRNLDLFEPLHFTKYPFQPGWLHPRPAIYKKQQSDFFAPPDSMRTHPEIAMRKARITPRIRNAGQLNLLADSALRKVAWAARVESTEAAIAFRWMDAALYEALLGLKERPADLYMITATARILVQLAKVSRDNLLMQYLPTGTAGYSIRMRMVNDLLHNLNRDEIVELGYHFINSSSHFRSDVEEHYLILAQLCDFSGRVEVKKRVAQSYATRFPKGKYRIK